MKEKSDEKWSSEIVDSLSYRDPFGLIPKNMKRKRKLSDSATNWTLSCDGIRLVGIKGDGIVRFDYDAGVHPETGKHELIEFSFLLNMYPDVFTEEGKVNWRYVRELVEGYVVAEGGRYRWGK